MTCRDARSQSLVRPHEHRARWLSRTIRRSTQGLAAGSIFCLAACSALDVNDPTAVQGSSIDNAIGVKDLIKTARIRYGEAAGIASLHTGILTDEFFLDADPALVSGSPDYFARLIGSVDRRDMEKYRTMISDNSLTVYEGWQTLFRDATVALPRIRKFGGAERDVELSEMFSFRAFAMLGLAEQMCPGFPAREVVNFKPVYGPPLTTDQAFAFALAQFDSALTYAGDSTRMLNLARVGKARTLLGLGRFADANTVAALVTPGYADSVAVTDNFRLRDGFADWQGAMAGVSNQEGAYGPGFVSAADSRIALTAVRNARYIDTSTVMYMLTKYGTVPSWITITGDIEAQLIRAEALLHAHDASWITILNSLRNDRLTPSLPPLTAPADFDDQVDLLFQERAFWLFGTAHRLGDLRRLVFRYGRAADSVFPSGPYRSGGTYATSISMAFNAELEHAFNPAVTGCTGP